MQTWIEFAVAYGYLEYEIGQELFGHYRTIFAALERLIDNAAVWLKPLE